MNYQSYEDYMRSVLGYSPYNERNYTYTDSQEDMYSYADEIPNTQPTQDLTTFYPEIYKIIYPMVCKVCNLNFNRELTKELLEQMIDEIYKNVEPEETECSTRTQIPLKNGDVRNPNSKDPEISIKETRQTNFLLRDLIRILILRELERLRRPHIRPPFNPSGRPPMPPNRPGNGQGRPPMSSPPRPRYF